MEEIGFKKLQELRKKEGLTYQKMADKLNVSKCYYWQVENGQRTLKYSLAFKIARIFKTKPDKIFWDEMKNSKL